MRSLLLALLMLCPLLAAADQPAASPPATAAGSAIPPAPLPDDSSDEPQIVIKQHGSDRYEEYRIHGMLYMIRVTPARGRPYYLVDPRGDGQFVRKDLVHGAVSPPMWVLHQW